MKIHLFSDRGSTRSDRKGIRTLGTSFVKWKEGGRGSRKDGMGRTSFIEDDLLYDAACRRESRTPVRVDSCAGAPSPLGLVLRGGWIDVVPTRRTKPSPWVLPSSFVSMDKDE
jgi:hypothetical protein